MKAFPAIRMGTASPDTEGMDLQDYFAAMAMQAIISNNELLLKAVDFYKPCGSELSVARLAYDQAEAMMEARNNYEPKR
jgi:hypothetical protein